MEQELLFSFCSVGCGRGQAWQNCPYHLIFLTCLVGDIFYHCLKQSHVTQGFFFVIVIVIVFAFYHRGG